MELDIDMLITTADDLNEKAETAASKKAHEMIVKSYAMRKNAKHKRKELDSLSALLEEEAELKAI